MKFALVDKGLGIARELPLLAEGAQEWAAQVALTHNLPEPAVRAVESEADVGPGEVVCYLQDKLDVDGAAAYHDEDNYGRQYIRCACSAVPSGELLRDRTNKGESLLGLLQHEIGEAMADPTADIWRQQPFVDRNTGRVFSLVCQEICDPVQEIADALTVKDGTQVDRIAWALPAWFDARRAQSRPVDSHGALTEPLTLAPGGYVIAAMVSTERDVFAELLEHHVQPLAAWRRDLKRRPGSRTLRRLASFGDVLA
jgi:hypothetical protein